MALRRIEVVGPQGTKARLLDEVDVITGVSGGSFTALAFGLYGDKLFDVYETSFLKRNVQGELIRRILSPRNWGALWSKDWSRSEVAAQLYDEILFHGATFADLDRSVGPLIVATATNISTGGRLEFQQSVFDYLCSDLDAVPLSRAAAASSAVPLVLAAVTFNNYGGSCKFAAPEWAQAFSDPETAPRPAARAAKEIHDLEAYQDGAEKPYVHLVDGALSDNLGMRGVLETLEELEDPENWRGSRHPRSRAQDRHFCGRFEILAEDQLGQVGAAAERPVDRGQGDRSADRSFFL